ncbi:hypothetical protein E1B28_003076 [Marasmius oreades]|uniref:SAP domain-containing protein n=1 Tax=Marasmius oreades TaxID=181124 RepID=A0A9P7ULV8_9AGAR|nr:uncharacterized protein E1B28_003076 [Marasmius oreades]KAG7085516.1 hypothetical protein E1B28_003076 [Marasmius oreades]
MHRILRPLVLSPLTIVLPSLVYRSPRPLVAVIALTAGFDDGQPSCDTTSCLATGHTTALAFFLLLPLVLAFLLPKIAAHMGSTSTELTPLNIVQDNSDECEFPSAGGDAGVRKIKLSQLKWEQLKCLCQELKLGSSGTKAMLVACLKEYSSKRDNWNLSKPGVHHPHKGLRADTKKALKGSHKRRAEIIKEMDLGVVQRSKDTRSQQQKEDMVLWAKKYICNHPPRP